MSLIGGAHGNTRLQPYRLAWNWDVAMGSIYGDVLSIGWRGGRNRCCFQLFVSSL